MFLADIKLVEQQVNKYGLIQPFVDLGGLAAKDVTVADYDITLRTGGQHDRYLKLDADPFTPLAGKYPILNPQYGDPSIEMLPAKYPNHFGTAVCLNVVEHVVNPFEVFKAIYALMQRGGLVIVTTVLNFPVHAAPRDFWRYTPDCLRMLGEYAGFKVLESDFHLIIYGDAGIKEIHTGVAQEVMADYVTLRKP